MIRAIALILLSVAAAAAAAQPRAWLDRERIELGETVTLNVEIVDSMSRPDFAALERDFEIRGSSSSTQMTLAGGRAVTKALWAVALEPRREGVIAVPPVPVGNEATPPLTLTVLPPRARSAASGDPVFVETEIGTRQPYVHQAVTYTVRLYYALTLLEGQLDAPDPDGAALRRLGEDATSTQIIDEVRYNVVERRYVLIPERSGALTLAPPRFRGRTLASAGARFGSAQTLSAMGEPFELEVRPRPAAAALPWLPARALTLDYAAPPGQARVGEPLTLTLRLRGEGLTAEQVPDIALPDVAGVQVYPEAPSYTEQVRQGRPVVEWTRRFALVAAAPGRIEIPAFGVDWWDVDADQAAHARVAATAVEILPSTTLPAAPSATDAPALDDAPARSEPAPAIWPMLAALFASLWLLTIAWGWRRGRRVPAPQASADVAPASNRAAPDLRKALRDGDLDRIARALLACAPAPAPVGLSALASKLTARDQAAAVRQLESARWGGGDPVAALAALRSAFAQPPQFADGVAKTVPAPLPPHYPRA